MDEIKLTEQNAEKPSDCLPSRLEEKSAAVGSSSRKRYLSVLSVIACLSVLCLHINSGYWTYRNNFLWYCSNLIECLFYFAAPVFFMITGATLIDYNKRYSTRQYAKKRLTRVGIPFLFWSVFGLLFRLIAGDITWGSLTLRSVINSLVNTRYMTIYWFFISLFVLYLAIPLFSNVADEKKRTVFGYLIAVGFTLNAFLPLLFNLLHLEYNQNLMFGVCSEPLLYALLGYYIDRYEIPKTWRTGIYAAGIAGLLIHLFGTALLSHSAGQVITIFKGYGNVPCILYAVAIFTLFKYTDKTRVMAFLEKLVKPLSDCTFGIYLTHMFALETVIKVSDRVAFGLPLRILLEAVALVLVIALVKLLTKIPYVRRIVG